MFFEKRNNNFHNIIAFSNSISIQMFLMVIVTLVYINKRYDNHKEHLYRYTVRKRDDIMKVIIPFFEKHTLKTSKKKNFKLFAKSMREIQKGSHLTKKGIIKIAKLSEQMNHKKSKANIIRILRNQTPKSHK